MQPPKIDTRRRESPGSRQTLSGAEGAVVRHLSNKAGRLLQGGNSPLQQAKDRLTIPEVWHLLALPGKPGHCVTSPFRSDRKPSFSVFDQGRKFKDHATGEAGDVVDFVALALRLDKPAAARWVCQEAGTMPTPGGHQGPPRPPRPAAVVPTFPAPDRRPLRLPDDLRRPTVEELDTLAQLRGWGRMAPLEASKRGLLFTASMFDGPDRVPVWILTDATRRNAQARRMDGKPWQSIGAKAKTLPGARASWPVGLSDAEHPDRKAVLLVEGGPDLISAFHLILHAGMRLEQIAVCAVLGATQHLEPEALAILEKLPVWIFPHGDNAGEKAVDSWAEPLLARGHPVNVFRVASLGHTAANGEALKDLNDLCRVPFFAGEPYSLRRCVSLCRHLDITPILPGTPDHDFSQN